MSAQSPRTPWILPLAGIGILALTCAFARGQNEPATELPPPRPVAENTVAAPAAHAGEVAEPISLPAALKLAQTNNLDIAQAQATVQQFQAILSRARAQLLPNLNLGSTYAGHDGQIQKTEGNIITVNKDSLFMGGGPSLSVQLTDAIFSPLAARQVSLATQAGHQRVIDNTLLAVAEAYFSILRARRRLARVDETLEFLTSERPSEARGKSKGLLPLIRDIVEVGGKDAFRADLERVRTEVLRRQEERAGALLDFRVASAELARLLRLDPALLLCPIEDFRSPVPLPGGEWVNRPIEELVTFALANRPELAENQALVAATVQRVRAAQFRPLLPSFIVNYSYGDFGGSPDPNPPIVTPPTTPGGAPKVTAQPGFGPSGQILHFKNRDDWDITLVWRLQNMGIGNRAEIREQKALQQQAQLRLLQAHDLVATQVVQAQELVKGWWERVLITRSSLFDEKGDPEGPVFHSIRLNFERIRGAEGRPLEVIDSIRGLNDQLESFGQDLTDYERSRFRLLIALGLPSQALCNPVTLAPANGEKGGAEANPEP